MAVGRTYYGLFLVAREQLGIVASRGVHDAVSRELATRELGDLGSKIGQLRSVRELADYQLVPSNPRWRDWTWNWRYVRRIANSAVKEMVSIGWITEPIVFPTD